MTLSQINSNNISNLSNTISSVFVQKYSSWSFSMEDCTGSFNYTPEKFKEYLFYDFPLQSRLVLSQFRYFHSIQQNHFF